MERESGERVEFRESGVCSGERVERESVDSGEC